MVDAADHKRGILIDLDIAARVKDGSQVLYPSLTYAGTLGFRSIDLLDQATHFPNRAVYRDDLESFYYALLYIQKFYRGGSRLPIHDTFGWWDLSSGGMTGIGIRKLAQLGRDHVTAEAPLYTWLVHLRSLLSHAYSVRNHDSRSWSPAREATLDNRLTYDTFMGVCNT